MKSTSEPATSPEVVGSRSFGVYRFLLERIAEAEKRLDAISATNPATQFLESISGVGPRTAEAVSAHIGDAKRFANAKQVGSYAGLVPKQYQSGTTDRKGRIARTGPPPEEKSPGGVGVTAVCHSALWSDTAVSLGC